MKYQDHTRANNFDRRCGFYQTLKTMELGVGKSILDIGCGIGEFTPYFLWKYQRVCGLDPEEKFLNVARNAGHKITYIQGWGETFKLNEKFDTISMNNLLEHVDNPVKLLKNCKKHLSKKGRIIVQVPNSQSVTRQLGVLMEIIKSTKDISEKEKSFFGHKRAYTLSSLEKDIKKAKLKIIKSGGVIYKPLPNEFLEKLCIQNGGIWAEKFLEALYKFGEKRQEDCGYLYVSCA
jgi:2-polyprenyl-3-methyl-5-hydroxy-6-metoxy-1,4-benzoquinol methylase